jgi:hypothetical protein
MLCITRKRQRDIMEEAKLERINEEIANLKNDPDFFQNEYVNSLLLHSLECDKKFYEYLIYQKLHPPFISIGDRKIQLHMALGKISTFFEFETDGEYPVFSDVINATGFETPSEVQEYFTKSENFGPQNLRYKPKLVSPHLKMETLFTEEEWLSHLEDWRIIVSKGEHIRKNYGNF